jgi:hypothetical protein
MKTKRLLFVLIVVLSICCCNDKDDSSVPVVVDNISMTNLGRENIGQEPIEPTVIFAQSNDTIKCMIRTKLIKKVDTLQSVSAYIKTKTLIIDIQSSPNEFECSTSDCYSIHEVFFDLIGGIKSNGINVKIGINNVFGLEKHINFD